MLFAGGVGLGRRPCSRVSSTSSSTISSKYIEQVIDGLRNKQIRASTAENYLGVWGLFNKFLIKLDHRPNNWEDRAVMFLAFMIDNGAQSSMVHSYLCTIKSVLKSDGYHWNENQVILTSMTRACRKVNDTVCCKLPITSGLLELILFEVNRVFGSQQLYLAILYQAIFAITYYGLMRISEIIESLHALKACNIHMAQNKNKILLTLHSSKTHGKDSLPQKIKIESLDDSTAFCRHRFYCPFDLIWHYWTVRGGYLDNSELFFVFKDNMIVPQRQLRTVFRDILQRLNLNADYYGMHSFRAGRASDMLKMNYSLSQIKVAGRWHSNAVYRYLK